MLTYDQKGPDIHVRKISQETAQPSILQISLKIYYLQFHSNLPGTNELKIPHTTTNLHVSNQRINQLRQVDPRQPHKLLEPSRNMTDALCIHGQVELVEQGQGHVKALQWSQDVI